MLWAKNLFSLLSLSSLSVSVSSSKTGKTGGFKWHKYQAVAAGSLLAGQARDPVGLLSLLLLCLPFLPSSKNETCQAASARGDDTQHLGAVRKSAGKTSLGRHLNIIRLWLAGSPLCMHAVQAAARAASRAGHLSAVCMPLQGVPFAGISKTPQQTSAAAIFDMTCRLPRRARTAYACLQSYKRERLNKNRPQQTCLSCRQRNKGALPCKTHHACRLAVRGSGARLAPPWLARHAESAYLCGEGNGVSLLRAGA